MITSASNQKMKNLMALCQKSKERRAQQSFIVEGSKMLRKSMYQRASGQSAALRIASRRQAMR